MPSVRAGLVILSAGLVTFGLVFTVLQATRSEAAPGQLASVPTPALARSARSPDSFAPKLADGTTAVGVPITGSEVLLRDVQPGDRVDVLASLPAPADGRPVTGVVVRGALVLQAASSSDPLLLEVPAPDAMALAHLMLRGSRLGYILWSANAGTPAESPPLDERAARSLLGLAPAANQIEPQASPVPIAPGPTQATAAAVLTATPAPQSAAIPRFGGFLYQTQPGDTWESIATTFGLSVIEMKRWNDTATGGSPVPGTLVLIPRS